MFYEYYEKKIARGELDVSFLEENMKLFFEKIKGTLALFTGKYFRVSKFCYSEKYDCIEKIRKDEIEIVNVAEAIACFVFPVYNTRLVYLFNKYVEQI